MEHLVWASTITLALLLVCMIPAGADPPSSQDDLSPPVIIPARPYTELPVAQVSIDLHADEGPLELWRHTLGLGGINSTPLPQRVISGAAKLHPRLVRIFIQEFFHIYPQHGRFDWSRLDPYMESIARTGAKVVAAITIKPKPLFPVIDQNTWRPNNVEEWQRVITALVKRYSVDRHIVTYWEIGNETDIGENGGCPYLISSPQDYADYYRMTIEPILAAFPQARVGGTAVANASGDYLPGFIEICHRDQLRLDFISWHLYSDRPEQHASLVQRYQKLLESFGQKRPEMLVTEWSKSFEPVSVEELAFDPRRAAIVASCILAMNEAHLDWSFYYHLWDQVAYTEEFKPFFARPNIMYHHWNEVPHRFGLFGVGQEVRPQYFVYWMLERMGARQVHAAADSPDLRLLASQNHGQSALLLVNHAQPAAQDRIATVTLSGLIPGRKLLTVYRIDRGRAWSSKTLDLIPLEHREVDVEDQFQCQVFCPAESVCLLELDPALQRQ